MKKRVIIISLIIGLVILYSFQRNDNKTVVVQYKNITVEELAGRLHDGETLTLLDVRTESEYTGPLGHIEGSMLIPVQELQSRLDELAEYRDKEIIVICRSGNRSRIASKILAGNGFKATNLLGGMKAWREINKIPSVQKNTQLPGKPDRQTSDSGKTVED